MGLTDRGYTLYPAARYNLTNPAHTLQLLIEHSQKRLFVFVYLPFLEFCHYFPCAYAVYFSALDTDSGVVAHAHAVEQSGSLTTKMLTF